MFGKTITIGENAAHIARTSKSLAAFYIAGMTIINVTNVVVPSYLVLRFLVGHPIFSKHGL